MIVRFDEFVQNNGIPFAAVEQFDGYLVEVVLPPDWEPVHAPSGLLTWVWRNDPCNKRFCANAVLTMARAEADLDPTEVFTMLCEYQVQMLPGIHEMHRDAAVEHEGPGLMGALELLINTDLGVLECVVLARVIASGGHTLIAQLTLTALPESSVPRSQIGFGMFPAPVVATASSPPAGGTPLSAPLEAR